MSADRLGVEPNALGVAFDDVYDALSGQPISGHAPTLYDRSEHWAVGDLGSGEPRSDRSNRTSHNAGDDGDDRSLALLVGFRSCDPYAEPAFDFFEVVDVQGDELGAT
jgi:hypothetical protein